MSAVVGRRGELSIEGLLRGSGVQIPYSQLPLAFFGHSRSPPSDLKVHQLRKEKREGKEQESFWIPVRVRIFI